MALLHCLTHRWFLLLTGLCLLTISHIGSARAACLLPAPNVDNQIIIDDGIKEACTWVPSSDGQALIIHGSIRVDDAPIALTIYSYHDNVRLENYGTICGDSGGVEIFSGFGAVSIINYGTIEGRQVGIINGWPELNGGTVRGGFDVDCSTQ